MNSLTEQFLSHLRFSGVSKVTLKNYKSDIRAFVNWFSKVLEAKNIQVVNLQECLPFVEGKTITAFKLHLTKAGTPPSTINRRLSTLRRLGSYLAEVDITDGDITKNILNVTKSDLKTEGEIILERYKEYLKTNNISENTVKNYTADIRQFLNWGAKNVNVQN